MVGAVRLWIGSTISVRLVAESLVAVELRGRAARGVCWGLAYWGAGVSLTRGTPRNGFSDGELEGLGELGKLCGSDGDESEPAFWDCADGEGEVELVSIFNIAVFVGVLVLQVA